jgi:hypothetical protein
VNAARMARSMAALVLLPSLAVLASCEPAGDGRSAPAVAPTTIGPLEARRAPLGADASGASGPDLASSSGLVAVAGVSESAPVTTVAPAARPAAAPGTTAPGTTAPPRPSTVPAATATPPPTAAAPPTTAPAPPPTTPAAPPTSTRAPSTANAATVAGVGDSIMLAAKPRLEALPGWTFAVDAVVGRQFGAGIPLLASAASTKPGTVVLGLGTNGPVSDSMFDAAMKNLAGVPRVVVVTVQLPDAAYPHERPTNDVLRRGAARWGAVVADWNAVSAGRPDALAPDGYHLSSTGMQLYVSMMGDALARAAAGPVRA